MYRLLFEILLRRIDAERAHALARRSLRIARATAAGRAVIRRLAGRTDGCLQTDVLGLTFPSPIGVAAGLDKEADWFDDLGALGFGFVEVGTITAAPQDGNPPPRVARLVEQRALVNRMGFPNPGAEVAARRLAARRAGGAARRPATVVGVNVGRSSSAAPEESVGDYRASVRRLAPVSDYVVLNVSSPNTPGLRALQEPAGLRELIAGVRDELAAIRCHVPLLVKIAPDLADERIVAIVRLALELGLDGIVAVNTTVDRSLLSDSSRAAASFEDGGISGAPLRARAVEVLRCIRREAGNRLVVISVGGIDSAADVWERILAGASLVQVYTAFVYGGPGWPRRVSRELARKVRASGRGSIGELVGCGSSGCAWPARNGLARQDADERAVRPRHQQGADV